MVTLSYDSFTLTLAPEQGGCVSKFHYRDRHILRPARSDGGEAWDARDFAAFPMLPFCGRVINGRLTVDGNTIQLAANMAPEPHAIHGLGWQAGWLVESQSEAKATMMLEHDGEDWPWAFTAYQTFQLTRQGLELTIGLTNRGETSMPAGLGWHPYFPREGATLTAQTSKVWSPGDGETLAQPHPVPPAQDLSRTREVGGMVLDHAYTITHPGCAIAWPDLSVAIRASDIFDKLTVYIPPDEPYFCAEPLTQAPGTLDRQIDDAITGVRMLSPGETLTGEIQLIVEARA